MAAAVIAAIAPERRKMREAEDGDVVDAEHEDGEEAFHTTPELVRRASSGDLSSIEHIKTVHKIRELKFRVQDPGRVQNMDMSELAQKLGMSQIEANACHIAFLAYDVDGSGELDPDEALQAFTGAMVDMSASESMKWNVHYDNGENHIYTRAQFAKKFGTSRCHGHMHVSLCLHMIVITYRYVMLQRTFYQHRHSGSCQARLRDRVSRAA